MSVSVSQEQIAILSFYFLRKGTSVSGGNLQDNSVTPSKLSFSPATSGDLETLNASVQSLSQSQDESSGEVTALQGQVSVLQEALGLLITRVEALEDLLASGFSGEFAFEDADDVPEVLRVTVSNGRITDAQQDVVGP